MDNIYFYFNNLKINTTIVTSVTEIKELIQHRIVHNLEG